MFHGQGVKGEVLGMETEDQFNRSLPAVQGLLRQTKDQVQIQVVETCPASPGHCIDYIKVIMDPFQLAEFFRMCGLDTQTDAVKTEDCEGLEGNPG